MPPRPFSEVVSEGYTWTWGPNEMLKRPEHAAYVAAVVGAWSHSEAGLVRLLATILKRSARSAVLMLDELRSFDRQATLVRRVARIELPPDDAALVDAVLGIVAPLAKVRNQFAHHIWGVSPLVDDGLLLAPPELQRDWYLVGLEMSELHHRWRDRPQPDYQRHNERILVYRLSDLKEAHAQMERAARLLFELDLCLGWSSGPPGFEMPELIEIRARYLRDLRSTPDIAAELAKRAARKSHDSLDAGAASHGRAR